MSMEISIDILLLSVNPIRVCKVFSQEIFRVINLQIKGNYEEGVDAYNKFIIGNF